MAELSLRPKSWQLKKLFFFFHLCSSKSEPYEELCAPDPGRLRRRAPMTAGDTAGRLWEQRPAAPRSLVWAPLARLPSFPSSSGTELCNCQRVGLTLQSLCGIESKLHLNSWDWSVLSAGVTQRLHTLWYCSSFFSSLFFPKWHIFDLSIGEPQGVCRLIVFSSCRGLEWF